MHGHVKNILYTILIIFFCTEIHSNDDFMNRHHSLVKPYQGAGISIPFWDYDGSTMVSSNYIRLTADLQSKSGSLWNQVPIMSRNWEMTVHFKVHGKGKDLYGDGFVIWYVRDRMFSGPVFGSKDYFSGLAVILDTYSNHNGVHNHQHPYISAMVNNGTLTYDHDRDGTHTQLAGCEAKFRNSNFDTIVSIRYENDVLTVSTNMENKGTWKECFKVDGVKLPTGYYIGASATTGDLCDNHDIIAIRFYEILQISQEEALERLKIVPEAASFEAPRPRTEDVKPGMSNVKIFFLILFGMIFAVVAAVFGIMYYQKYKENSRKLW